MSERVGRMSARAPRFEVVRSDAGWFARFIASNGREVWRTSEVYARRRAADTAVRSLIWRDLLLLEWREVDER